MKYNPDIHHRRSTRLKGYDYSRAGAYFVTICTQNRESLFGDIVNGEMVLNDAGQMVKSVWTAIPKHYPGIDADAFQIMPNHIHGIIVIVGADLRVCPPALRVCPPDPRVRTPDRRVRHDDDKSNVGPHTNKGAHIGAPLPGVVQWFKTMTTNEYIRGVKQFGWPRFDGRLWQRNYYEHIIRDDDELNRVREYIINNPLKWKSDRENRRAKSIGHQPEAAWPR